MRWWGGCGDVEVDGVGWRWWLGLWLDVAEVVGGCGFGGGCVWVWVVAW